MKVQRALVSVYDKRGLAAFARCLTALGVEVLSTGGTAQALAEAGVQVVPVADVTGFPEILDGRVKTLHPAIHGGILADRGRSSHLGELAQHGIAPIDLVAVNLYPFRETAAATAVAFDEVVEMIDIGGPCLVRAAAKNHAGVVVVVDPDDYPQIVSTLEQGEGEVPAALRRRLALKAFRHTQAYDAAIACWLERRVGAEGDGFRRHLLVDLEREAELRYGENPHQQAALYRTRGGGGVFGGFRQLAGKELSFNNLLDADAARRVVAGFAAPAVAIVKHANPCGVGRGPTPAEAWERALATDPVSAFGGIVAVNAPLDASLAERLAEVFIEVVIAPGVDEAALPRLIAKPGLRLLAAPPFAPPAGSLELRALDGGFLAQTPDVGSTDPHDWPCPTRREPTVEELAALELAWAVVRHVKSNAIVIANRDQTVGIGAGQMSRVDSCRLAVAKARLPLAGTVAASDAFFPFRDGLDVLAAAGVTAVAQPGGSKRDAEVVAAADEHGLAMVLTGSRRFRH